MNRRLLCGLLCLVLLLPFAVPVYAAETIYNINITITPPALGTTPCFFTETVKNDKGLSGVAEVMDVRWYRYNPGQDVTASDKFVSGVIYEVTVQLKPASGYVFAKNAGSDFYVEATVNGMPASVTSVYGNSDQINVTYRFDPLTGSQIMSAAVNDIAEPVAGNTPDYIGGLGSKDYKFLSKNDNTFKNGITWYDCTDFKYVPTNHKFIGGHTYMVEIHLVPAGTMPFSLDTQGSVNGISIGTVAGDEQEIALMYTFPACIQSGEMLISASVSGIDKPFQDKLPDYTGTLGSSKYKFLDRNDSTFKNGITWYDSTASRYIKTTEKFQPDHAYMIEIHLVPASGYYFSEDVIAKVDTTEIYASGGGQEIAIVIDMGLCPYHTCKLTEVKEVKPTCTEDGKKAYYHCDECEKDFEDTMATRPIENLDTWGILKGEHKWDENWSYSNKKGHAHSCLNEGCKEHDELQEHELKDGKCTICGYGKEKTEDETEPTQELQRTEKGKRRTLRGDESEGPDLTLVIIIVAAVVVVIGVTAVVIIKRMKK